MWFVFDFLEAAVPSWVVTYPSCKRSCRCSILHLCPSVCLDLARASLPAQNRLVLLIPAILNSASCGSRTNAGSAALQMAEVAHPTSSLRHREVRAGANRPQLPNARVGATDGDLLERGGGSPSL